MLRRFWWERPARSLRNCSASSKLSSALAPNRSRDSISRTTRYTYGLVIRGIFPLQARCMLERKAVTPGTGPRGDVTLPYAFSNTMA